MAEATQAPVETAQPAGETPPARPDWLPEQFWKENAPDVEGLGKSYAELRSAYSAKTEKLRAEVLADLRKEAPATADGYTFTVAPDWLPPGFEMQEPAADDPMLSTAREVMHELGATPAQWEKMTRAFVGWQVGMQPQREAELAKLGEGGEARVAAVDALLSRHLPKEAYAAMVGSMTTAGAITAIETLIKALGNGATPGGMPGGSAPTAMTSARLSEIMAHPDYFHPQKGETLREEASAAIKSGVRPVGMGSSRR